MKNKVNKIKGKQSQQKGAEYEKFVAEVFNYYERLYKDRMDFVIIKNYYNLSVSKKEICDVYFSYKDDNDKIIHTFVQCKSGEFTYKKINYQCIGNYSKLKYQFEKQGIDIEKTRKILCYQEEDQMTEEIKKLCQKHNIELKHIMFSEVNNNTPFATTYFFKQFVVFVEIDDNNLKKINRLDIHEREFYFDNNKKPIYYTKDIDEVENFINKNKDKLISNENPIYDVFKKIKNALLLTEKWKDEAFKKVRNNIEISNIFLFDFLYENNKKKLLLLVKYKLMFFNDGNTEMKINNTQFIYCRKKLS